MNLPDRRVVCLSFLGASLLLTLLFLVAEIGLLRIPYQRDYGEGHVLWLTMQGLDAYKPIDSPPYVVNPYTPLYMLAARLVNLLSGDLLMAGRCLSLLSTLGIGLVLALTVYGVTPARAPRFLRMASAAGAGVFPLLTDSVTGWAPLMRVDMLALFLMFAGLYVYVCRGTRERWQHVAGVLFVLALFTKETMLSAPLACLTFGLVVDFRRTLRVCAGAALLLAAGVLAANAVTHGGFLTHIVAYNRNPFSWRVAAVQIYDHLRSSWLWLAVAAATLLAVRNPAAVRSASPYGRAVIIAALNLAYATVLLVTLGKLGTNYNHFLAWDISACLLCGLFLYRFLATSGLNRSRAAAGLCAVLLAGLLLPPMSLLHGLKQGLFGPNSWPEEDNVLELIRQSPGPVFSENLLMLIQADKPVAVEPATVTFLSLTGAWDEQPYVSLFQQQYFRLLVTEDIHFAERYTPAVTSAIDSAYVPRRRIGKYLLYYPRDGATLR
jgi:hypothetical protein